LKYKLTILAVLFLAGASFAQESISSGDSISQGMRIIPPVVPLCTISTTSLAGGTQGVAYDDFVRTKDCFPPVSFAVISGTLPSWATLNQATGEITGVPDSGSTSTFVVQATDGLLHHDQFSANLTITATSNGSPLPPDPSLLAFNLSLAGTPASGPTICVGTPLDATQLPGGVCGTSYPGTTVGLQTALDNAACGQIINVANVQGLGPVTLPSNVKCPLSNWWWLAFHDLSDPVFPPEMTRVDPSYAGIAQSVIPQYPYPGANAGNTPARHMSQIVVPATSNKPCLSLNVPTSGTNTQSIGSMREWGLDCTRDQSSDAVTALIDLNFQPGQTTSPANPNQDCSIVNGLPVNPLQCYLDQPDGIILDRNFIHGDAQRQTVRGLSMGGGRNIFVINNFGIDIQDSFAGGQGDAQFFSGGFGRGYTKVGNWYFFNNQTSSSSEGQLFCGAQVEAKNPVTGADGIPTSVIEDHDWFVKNFLWDTQRGQSSGETLINEGTIYPPVGDQELIFNPLAFQVQQGLAMPLNNTWINDSRGGWNRFNDAGGSGTVTVDGVDYKTINSANGIVTKANVTVGSAPWRMESIIQWTYTACSGNNVPAGIGCTVATTPGNHVLVFDGLTVDGRLATNGKDRHIINTLTATVTTGAPTNQIFITPSAPDLQIQPSYSDAFNNKRTFGYEFTAGANFSSVSLTWKVDGLVNGDSTQGQICKVTAVPCTAPGSNDSRVVYVSGTGLGAHTISVVSAAGTTTSQPINVSTTSPIWAYDLKAETVKNGWEVKCVSQAVLKNSIVENSHGSQGNGGGQNISAIAQSANNGNQVNDGNGVNVGYGPEHISDLLIDHVHFLHMGNGLAVAGLDVALGAHRLTFSNLLLEDINESRYGHGFNHPEIFSDFLQFSGTGGTLRLSWTSAATPLVDNVFFKHITQVGGAATVLGAGVSSWISLANTNLNNTTTPPSGQYQLGPFAVNDSIFQVPGTTPFADNNGLTNNCNKAGGPGANNTEALAFQGKGYIPALPCFSSYSLNRNALADNKTNPLNFTSTIWEPNSTDADLFIKSGDNGDYRVPFGSQYDAGGAKDASDDLALGADIDGIIKSDAEVRWGSLSPLQIATTTLPTATHGTAYSFLLTVTGGTGPYTWSAPAGVVPPGAIDTLDYAAMPLPDRNSFHLAGTIVKYFKLDAGLLWWIKGASGNPWDGELVGPDYIKQWFTENTFTNASSFKMYINPVSLWSRYHVPGADDVVYTPGPNKYSTTTNCGLDNQPLIDNLGVRGELTGPFTDVTWQTTYGGNIPDNTPYLLAQKWIKCTANNIANCTNEEDYWLVKGYGQVRWCPKTWNGSTYVTGTCSQETTKTAGGPVPPNFACGVPHPPATDGLPSGNLLTNQPPFTLGDSSGILSGTPNAVGTTKFTVQVEDSLGHIAQKTLTLAVQ
jgi:hypothetical protein